MYKIHRLYKEITSQDASISLQRDAPSSRQSTSTSDISFVFFLAFVSAVVVILTTSILHQPYLENHEMCGLTTGGQEECFFACTTASCSGRFDVLVKDLPCLYNCFQNTPDNCVTPLLDDVISKGVCNLTNPDSGVYWGAGDAFPERNDCEIDWTNGYFIIENGTCSAKTETLLQTEECLRVIFEQPVFISDTITSLLTLSCQDNVTEYYFQFYLQNNLLQGRSLPISNKDNSKTINKTKLNPAQWILEEPNIRTKLQYNNTRNRYPWACSLRSKGASPKHQCAVNLLSIPPSPTVLVGAAHCTYLCKDGSREVSVCCCSSDTDACQGSNPKCGDNPGVVEMTGADSTILCGEWDTSMADSVASGERYNVELPILRIIRHPDFDPAKGTINGFDIVVFKVDDRTIQNNVTESIQLWPACLPSQTIERPVTGIHTGWSNPPPFSFIQSNAEGYARFYDDFYKQWHYKMDISETCEDPIQSALSCNNLKFPSNSSYPQATVCAKDFAETSCFSTGDSGSPLMVQDDAYPDRFQLEGILSFVKGCSNFEFGVSNTYTNKTSWVLRQKTNNPTAYTKVSCFLPWIAEQYNMRYEPAGNLDQGCYTGSGDPQDEEKQTCRNTQSQQIELVREIEWECKFPFYYNGRKYNECILLIEEDFVYPIFRCPIRDITTKIDGINSFDNPDLVNGYCLDDQSDEHSPLNPEKKDCGPNTILAFSQCKNNCPGVRAFGIIGGGTVLAGIGTLGILGTFPSLFGIGALGILGVGGGVMVAQETCAGPFFCISLDGQCCVVVINVSGLVCPDTC